MSDSTLLASTTLVTSANAAAWLGLPIDDTSLFAAVLSGADGAVKAYLGYDPSPQSYTEVLNGTGCEVMPVNNVPVTALSSASYRPYIGASPVPILSSQLTFDDFSIIWVCPFPYGRKNVTVSYTAGYAAGSPQLSAIQHAELLQIKAMWSGKDFEQNASSMSYGGVISQGFWPNGPGNLVPQVQGLLEPYRKRMSVS